MNRTTSGVRWIELLVVIIILTVLALLFLPGFMRYWRLDILRMSPCQSTLKHWGQVLSMYADEDPEQKYPYMHIEQKERESKDSEGLEYPMLLVIPKLELLYPSLTGDFGLLYCPAQSERDDYIETIQKGGVNGLYEKYQGYHFGYVYFGWVFDRLDIKPAQKLTDFPVLCRMMALSESPAIQDTESIFVTPQFAAGMDTLFSSLLEGNEAKMPLQYFSDVADNDLTVTASLGNGGGDTIHRIAKGIERFFITDYHDPGATARFQSSISVMMETYRVSNSTEYYFNHIPGGCNVLFMDGHLEFVRYVSGDPGPDIDAGAAAPILPGMASILDYLIDMRDGKYPALQN